MPKSIRARRAYSPRLEIFMRGEDAHLNIYQPARQEARVIPPLPRMDSNHDKGLQRPLCYRYTSHRKKTRPRRLIDTAFAGDWRYTGCVLYSAVIQWVDA